MSWIAKSKNRAGKISNSSLPSEAISVLPDVMESFCQHLSGQNQRQFTVDQLISWTKINLLEVTAYLSNERVGDIRTRFPNAKIFDAQNSCYHLSDQPSFWVEEESTGRHVKLFHHVDSMEYTLCDNWADYF